jgi:lipid-A-disaccharide synthase
VHTIKRLFHKLFVIFPFEVDFYKGYRVEAIFCGNPSWESIAAWQAANKTDNAKMYVALLPGSRPQEIKQTLPIYAALARKRSDLLFTVAGISGLPSDIYKPIVGLKNVTIKYDDSFAVLENAVAALVVSGTATFETALFNVPQVVCYKTSWLTYEVAKRVIKVPYISLVNLVCKKEVVKELIQHQFTIANVEKELNAILPAGNKREAVLADYAVLHTSLGPTNASERAAKEILKYMAKA